MTYLSANEIREKFIKFFESKKHKVIASDSVVPKNDPTVLFTTAGMQQFKRQFLGYLEGYSRAATSQKCIRTDDLDEVGQTNFHHTFFEMLGNFSFGDYFKKEAIAWAWEFLTVDLDIPAERLWVSVYKDDQEAFDIWKNDISIPEHRIFKLGDKSNFWPSNAKLNGPNGPCGPCSEIFFDYRPEDTAIPKDPDDIDGRFAEIWNLVFTQFNRKDEGVLEPLPNKNIDTGMGLERLCAVKQEKKSNFETDLFVPIIKFMEENKDTDLNLLSKTEKRIVADHIRAATFAISDGIIPSNKERGSVVKSLINRSSNLVLKNGGAKKPQVYLLVNIIAEIMKTPYPEIFNKKDAISDLIKKTEESFVQVWEQRIPELKEKIKNISSAEDLGHLLFLYQDTFGLPVTSSIVVAQGAGSSSDDISKAINIFNLLMEEQKERSRASSKMAGDVFVDTELDLNVPKTTFVGYETLSTQAKVLRIFKDQESVECAGQGDTVRIVLDQTPFYAESGGQTGDTGIFTITATNTLTKITDTRKLDNIFLHHAIVNQGIINIGDTVTATVNQERRLAIMRNHTATHLLQAALRQVLGEHVQQQGSSVDQERLRFDFTHPKGLTPEQKIQVEKMVNAAIAEQIAVEKFEMTMEEARQKGALAFFAEKYGEKVRVVHIDGYSTELCGGTHLDNICDIRLFKISSEGAIAQGIRRIEAVTADNADAFIELRKQREQEELEFKKQKEAEKSRAAERFNVLVGQLESVISQSTPINNSALIVNVYEDVDIGSLRRLAETAKQQTKSSVIIFASRSDESTSIVIAVTDDLVSAGINASEIIKTISPILNGSGGGKPALAQAGSKDTTTLDKTIETTKKIVTEKIKNS